MVAPSESAPSSVPMSSPTVHYLSDTIAPYPPVARRTKAAAAGLHLVFEPRFNRLSDRFTESPGYASDNSSPSVSSPYPLTPLSALTQPVVADDSEENDDCWNLVPYNIPWGPEYYRYEKGTLPGPDGACMFLRSPTPLKNRRTTKACNKCRERKAKCSGGRPACSRCLSRGYLCEYVSDVKRARGPTLGRQRRRDGDAPYGSDYASSLGDTSSTASSADPSEYAASAQSLSPKREENDDLVLYGELAYPSLEGEYDGWAPAAAESEGSLLWGNGAPLGYFQEAPFDGFAREADAPFAYENYASATGSEVPSVAARREDPSSVHAPQPMKCTGSLPFLSSVHDDASAVDGLGLQHGAVDAPPSYAAAYPDMQPLYDQSYRELDVHAHYAPAEMAYLPPFSDGQDEVAQHYAAVSAYHQDIIDAESLYTHYAA
ncbi:hypothetical protein B0H21DRAFT_291065 [Amylocystis lapponica]|nr:hypothetical protein B0H21DRAFT_291065 [Amylocystis lapponica]